MSCEIKKKGYNLSHGDRPKDVCGGGRCEGIRVSVVVVAATHPQPSFPSPTPILAMLLTHQ